METGSREQRIEGYEANETMRRVKTKCNFLACVVLQLITVDNELKKNWNKNV